MEHAIANAASVMFLIGLGWFMLRLAIHMARTGWDYMSANGNPRMRGSLAMPRMTPEEERAPFQEGIPNTIVMWARRPMSREMIEANRKLGPVTVKAQRFDFGRKPR